MTMGKTQRTNFAVDKIWSASAAIVGVVSVVAIFSGEVVVSYPESGYVTCALVGNGSPTVITNRATIMAGIPVTTDPTVPLATAKKVTTDGKAKYTLTLSNDASYAGYGYIVHTFEGSLTTESEDIGKDVLRDGDSCATNADIHYELYADNVIEFVPVNESSVVTVLGSNGEIFTPTSARTFTWQSFSTSDFVETTEAPEEEPQDVQHIIFSITVSFLTLGYAYFLWVTIDPLKLQH